MSRCGLYGGVWVFFLGSDATLAWSPCMGGLFSLRNPRAEMTTDFVTDTHLSALRVVFGYVNLLPGC